MSRLVATVIGLLWSSSAWAGAMDDTYYLSMTLDELEYQWTDGANKVAWDGAISYGSDDHTFVLEHSGAHDVDNKHFEGADLRLFYQMPVSDFFDFSVGAGSALGPGADHAFGVLKLSGLLKQFIHAEVQIVAGGDADLLLEWDIGYEMMFTQRLIGMLSLDGAVAATDDYGAGTAKGLVFAGAAYRLHYEFSREFAPYVGWQGNWLLGNSADWARAAGENDDEHAFVLGIRFSL